MAQGLPLRHFACPGQGRANRPGVRAANRAPQRDCCDSPRDRAGVGNVSVLKCAHLDIIHFIISTGLSAVGHQVANRSFRVAKYYSA